MTEDQREKEIKAVEEHGKQLVKYGDKKESLTYSQNKEGFLKNLLIKIIKKYKTQVNNLILII